MHINARIFLLKKLPLFGHGHHIFEFLLHKLCNIALCFRFPHLKCLLKHGYHLTEIIFTPQHLLLRKLCQECQDAVGLCIVAHRLVAQRNQSRIFRKRLYLLKHGCKEGHPLLESSLGKRLRTELEAYLKRKCRFAELKISRLKGHGIKRLRKICLEVQEVVCWLESPLTGGRQKQQVRRAIVKNANRAIDGALNTNNWPMNIFDKDEVLSARRRGLFGPLQKDFGVFQCRNRQYSFNENLAHVRSFGG